VTHPVKIAATESGIFEVHPAYSFKWRLHRFIM
jgi:hypothetical protein